MMRSILLFGLLFSISFALMFWLLEKPKHIDEPLTSALDQQDEQMQPKKRAVIYHEQPFREEMPTPEQKLDALSMEDIDKNISDIEREIADQDFVTRANAGGLSDEEFAHFRDLLKVRDQLFAAKVDVILADSP